MSIGIATILLVLVVLVGLAVASFFRHTLTALAVLAAIPVVLILRAFMGTTYAVLAIALVAAFATVIYTISDTLRLLRTAKRTKRELPPALAERRASTRRSGRSHIAA